MSWFVIALLAPFFWACSHLLDKFAVNNISQNYISFAFYLSIGNLLFAVLIFLIQGTGNIDGKQFVANTLVGLFIFLQYFVYSYSIEKLDVALVVPAHQTEPLFVLLLTFLVYGSTPNEPQLFGFMLIMAGSLYLSVDFWGRKMPKIPLESLLVFLSAFFGAIATFLTKFWLDATGEFWQVLALNYFGYGLGGVLLLAKKTWRCSIIGDAKKMRAGQYGVFIATSLFDGVGYLLFTLALALAVSPAMVSILASTLPIHVLLLSLLVARLYSGGALVSSLQKSNLAKFICSNIVVVGVVMISLNE